MQNKYFIETFLSDEFGLSKKEIELYLNLMKHGAATIIELSEISGMNRSTTHVNVDSLTRKGLVTQIKKGRGSRRLIMAEPVEKLALILENKKAKLETATKQLPKVMQELTDLKEESSRESKIGIRHYRGKDEVKLIYEDVLKASEIRAYVNCKELSKVFPGNVEKFLRAHMKNKKMHIWEILEDSKEAREYVKQIPPQRYYFRLTTKKLNLASLDYLLFDGKIAIIELDSMVGISGIILENKDFYKNAKAIHTFVWNSLPPA